ncbi:MAG: chemotaxis protein CheW [Gammaproteobacteria bacterium]|nr:chemotaxis protein CheW [Gammaproteobacteria bacterium]
MADTLEQLKCVLLTTNVDKLVLPNSAIAEIVPVRNLINVANKPGWLLGYLDWRGQSIPLVSFELIGGIRMPSLASQDVKAAVIYTVSDDRKFNFMAFLVQGAPQAVNIVPTDIISDSLPSEHPAIAQRVLVKGQQASVINMEQLETIIKDVM